MIKRFLVLALLSTTTATAFATPVNLGAAGNYTLLATGMLYNSLPMYGNLTLGSAAEIHGNVGARGELGLGADAIIHGNADYGTLTQGAGATVTGTATQHNDSAFWDTLYSDLQNASQYASGLTGISEGAITSSRTLTGTGGTNVFDLTSLTLTNGNLTLKGSSTDEFIINVAGGFTMTGGAAIVLDGINANNVLFNLTGVLNAGYANLGQATLFGTFIAPEAYFGLGDGLTLNGARFLGAGISGNLQTLYAPQRLHNTPPGVPEPAAPLLLALGLIGLGLIARRRRGHRQD